MTEIKAATNCDIIRNIFVDLHCCQNFLLKTNRKPGVNGLSGAGVFRAYCTAVIFLVITFTGTDVLLVILQSPATVPVLFLKPLHSSFH